MAWFGCFSENAPGAAIYPPAGREFPKKPEPPRAPGNAFSAVSGRVRAMVRSGTFRISPIPFRPLPPMAAALQTFRQYLVCQNRDGGGTVDLWRDATEAACLALDPERRVFVELRVVTAPPERQRDAESFLQVVRMAETARDRHVSGVLEGGQEDGALFYIADYQDGERLRSWLDRCAPLPPWLALQLTLQAAHGLRRLAEHPPMLAGVEPLRAVLVLEGSQPRDLSLRLHDFGLGLKPETTDPRRIEARAIRQTAALLLRALTGREPEKDGALPETPGLAPEARHLLERLFHPHPPDRPETLEQLWELLCHAAQDLAPEWSDRPDRLPATMRPRLPLAEFFAPPEAVAEVLRTKFTVDPRPFDAAEPYRFRAAERSSRRRAVVQTLPPDHLFPPSEMTPPATEIAARLVETGPDSHLLRPHRSQDAASPELLVEEWPGTWSLDRLRRTRRSLLPEETLLILRQCDAAAREAEALGLPLHWQSPPHVAVHFPGGEDRLPPPLQRARLPLTEWPEFRLKFRAWPVTLNFTQPERFQIERLSWTELAESGSPATAPLPPPSALGAPPRARDLATLAVWLSGGPEEAPEFLHSWLAASRENRAETSAAEERREFLEHFARAVEERKDTAPARRPLWEPPVRPPSPAPPPPPNRGKLRERLDRVRKRLSFQQAPREPKPVPPVPAAAVSPSPPPEPEAIPEEPEVPALGFAEALFRRGAGAAEPDGGAAVVPRRPAGETFEVFHESPLFSGDVPAAEEDGIFPGLRREDEEEEPPLPPEESEASSRLMLFLVVVLIAAGLAALLAHFSGLAVWNHPE